MLVEGQRVEVELSKNNIDRYIELGYQVKGVGDKLTINAKHLPISSGEVLNFACDRCGELHEKKWRNHFDKLTRKEKEDVCSKCSIEERQAKFNDPPKEIRVYGVTKRDCLKRVITKEKMGYEVCFPIQQREGVIDKHDGLVRNYYYTIMRFAD